MFKLIKCSALLGAFIVSTAAIAAETQSTWSAASHLGYAVHHDAVTDFHNAGGSIVFLDASRSVLSDLELGLRTTGQGGKQLGKAYYRMGAGPLASWSASRTWTVQLAVQRYSESGLGESGDPLYRSRGLVIQAGWQRRTELSKRAELAWGGFVMRHEGRISSAEGTTGIAAMDLQRGYARGVEIALRLKL